MKKWAVLLALGLIFISLISPVFAQYLDFRQGSETVVRWIQDFAGPFFEVLFGSYEYVFEKVLFFVLIMCFIYLALDKSDVFGDNTTLVWIITLVVSLLATRYLTETALVKTILLPYSVLGITISAAIPLIIFFFFAMAFENTFTRRVLWALFIAVFIGLWIARYKDIGGLAWIYVLTAGLAFIFLVADGYLRRALIKQQMKELGLQRREQFEIEIKRQTRKAYEDLQNNIISPRDYRKIKRRLDRKLKALRKL